MKYVDKFKFRVDDMNFVGELKNESILKMLESIAAYHTDANGYGFTQLFPKKIGWVLLDWKIQVIKRPKYKQDLTVTTWERKVAKCYTYRDFQIQDESGDICVIASSKWTLIDIESGKLAMLSKEVPTSYGLEDESVFEEEIEKLRKPENIQRKIDYKVRKNEIDNNRHVHNIYYLNLAYEAIPDEVFFNQQFNNMRITYKKQIKYGETVECDYSYENGKHIVTMIRKEDGALHSIIEMW